jgi:hypothetical protein
MLKSGAMAAEIEASLEAQCGAERAESLGASILNKLELKLTQAGMRMTAERC